MSNIDDVNDDDDDDDDSDGDSCDGPHNDVNVTLILLDNSVIYVHILVFTTLFRYFALVSAFRVIFPLNLVMYYDICLLADSLCLLFIFHCEYHNGQSE